MSKEKEKKKEILKIEKKYPVSKNKSYYDEILYYTFNVALTDI